MNTGDRNINDTERNRERTFIKDSDRDRERIDSNSDDRIDFDNNREGFLIDSSIDGQDCSIHPEDLKQEKERIDEKFQEVLEELKHERLEHMNVYDQKASVIQDNDQYKEDIYQEKIRQLREEQEMQNRVFEEKIAKVRSEIETAMASMDNKVGQLNQERDVQLRIIDDKMEEVKHEKMKYDELYRIQLGKIKLDNEYKEQMAQVKEERFENQEAHLARQEQLRREKQYRESDFARNMERERNAALIKLKELEGYTVAKGDPDVRGWTVISKNGREVGKIDELIVDKEAMKVRYLDIDLNDSFLESGRDRHLLLPIGVAEIDEHDDLVFIPGIDRALVNKIPAFSGDQVTRDYETTLINVLSADNESETVRSDEGFYDREQFNDSNFYRSRRDKNRL